MPLVRHYSALFQDQLQAPYIGDVLERIGPDHNQVGELAHLHCAQFGADAAHRSAMSRGRYQRLPRRRAVASPQPHLEQRGVLERADVGAQCHSYTGIERLAEPRGVYVRGCLGTATERLREPAVGNPSGFEPVGDLAGRKMADGEGRHVPRIVLEQELDALVIHDVAMLDAMGAEPDRILYCIRVGGMRHDLEAALPADLEGSADLVVEQERMGVEVPRRPHDTAREVKLDVVDTVLDLLADGFHPTIGAVNLQRMTRGQKMSARGGEEITAGEQPRADMLSGVEGPLPCDVHEVMGAGAAHSDNAGFGKRGREPVAEQGHLIGERHLVEGQVIRMNVHVPEAGHQIPAFEIDHLRVAGAARLSAWQDGADATILDQHGTIRPYLGLDAVDQIRMRKDCLHGGLLGLESEILGSTAAPKRRSASPASGAYWSSEQTGRDWCRLTVGCGQLVIPLVV